jgi:hypothetical protein
MRMRFTGASMKFADESTPRFEEVRDDEWTATNREPATDAEICRMSPEQYRSWMETGKKPALDEQPVISGEGRPATNAVQLNEPSTEKQTTGMSAEIREGFATSGTYSPGLADVAANERFALASDRKNGYDSGRPSADEMAKMSPGERFKAASDARNRLNPNYQQDARLRRR